MASVSQTAAAELAGRRLRVLVVDDHEVVRWGARTLLARVGWVERCLQAGTRDEALALARRYEPHVAVVDVLMDGESGFVVAQELREVAPATRVLLTSGGEPVSKVKARAAGAVGFVAKRLGGGELLGAVGAAATGGTWFPPSTSPTGLVAGLSPRERDILQRMATGATNRTIAIDLGLSPNTVKQHGSSAFRKLGARNRAEAVSRAQDLALIGMPQTRHASGP